MGNKTWQKKDLEAVAYGEHVHVFAPHVADPNAEPAVGHLIWDHDADTWVHVIPLGGSASPSRIEAALRDAGYEDLGRHGSTYAVRQSFKA